MTKKYTLNMSQTDFSLQERHANTDAYLSVWDAASVTKALHHVSAHQHKPLFFLHDGPPYANGNLHMGHFVNKVLKDTVLKTKRLQGYFAPFVPGFDCHGLPVELAVEKLGVNKKESPYAFLTACRTYAQEQVSMQMRDMKAFGVSADWASTYKTMDFSFERQEMESVYTLAQKGFLEKKFRPVHWCPACKSSLAEAEVEYESKHTQTATVLFQCVQEPDTFLLVWTTTPYTLPANQAVGFNAQQPYYRTWDAERQCFCVSLMKTPDSEPVDLSHWTLVSPYSQKKVPLFHADFVSSAGTGLVHLAPAFGMDDFAVCEKNGLHPEEWVDASGVFQRPEDLRLHQKKMEEVSLMVVDTLRKASLLFSESVVAHDYPHCWRHKTPLFTRTSQEWFLNLSTQKQQAVDSLANVQFFPASGRERLTSMLSGRESWCVSRNRLWGVPLPVDVETRELLSTQEFAKQCARVAEGGVAFGMEHQPLESFPPVLDVWFDSGVTHHTVTAKYTGTADLVLEGVDQHRGWFQSSLWSSVLLNGTAPYKAVLTHGFVVDAQGKKLSKSSKNYPALKELFKKYSPDLLRLWVLSQDFRQDFKFSEESLQQTSIFYKKVRNTLRFCLQNTQDYDWNRLQPDCAALHDPYLRYALHQVMALSNPDAVEQWNGYVFHPFV